MLSKHCRPTTQVNDIFGGLSTGSHTHWVNHCPDNLAQFHNCAARLLTPRHPLRISASRRPGRRSPSKGGHTGTSSLRGFRLARPRSHHHVLMVKRDDAAADGVISSSEDQVRQQDAAIRLIYVCITPFISMLLRAEVGILSPSWAPHASILASLAVASVLHACQTVHSKFPREMGLPEFHFAGNFICSKRHVVMRLLRH